MDCPLPEIIRLPTEQTTLCQEQGGHILRGFSIGCLVNRGLMVEATNLKISKIKWRETNRE
jgi:hypothetical protein